MTETEKKMAMALRGCVFVPGTGVKRFARDMAYLADRFPASNLTEKQAEYLRTAVIRFRRQIQSDVVELARTLGKQKFELAPECANECQGYKAIGMSCGEFCERLAKEVR